MQVDGWDLLIGDGRPGFSRGWTEDGEEEISYHRTTMNEGVRPLIIYRSFHGAFPDYCEVDQEFRLYHDLAEDKKNGTLLDFDSSGREIEVVRVDLREVWAQLKHLRQFQAGTRLHLAIYVDSVRYSQMPLAAIDAGDRHVSRVGPNSRWLRDISSCDFKEEFESFSRLLAKVILPPPPVEKAGIWPFEREEDSKDVSFVIGVDEDGDPVEHTSNPDSLANYFGANPNAPHYLTPVYFRREVLGKYFAEPERYSVSDGSLSCLNLWSCQIDNNLERSVMVFLGDLGRDLPYEERLHWRQFNIPPEGKISPANFRRSFLGQFSEAEALDLVFRKEYVDLRDRWTRSFGWPLYLPAAPGDEHLLSSIRIPVTNSQAEMDEQVLFLTKLLVDSLNEVELAARAGDLPEGAKGISKLEGFFAETGFDERDAVIQFLRGLQQLRSTGSTHRKGRGYEKSVMRLGLDPSRKPDAISTLLGEGTVALKTIGRHYLRV